MPFPPFIPHLDPEKQIEFTDQCYDDDSNDEDEAAKGGNENHDGELDDQNIKYGPKDEYGLSKNDDDDYEDDAEIDDEEASQQVLLTDHDGMLMVVVD